MLKVLIFQGTKRGCLSFRLGPVFSIPSVLPLRLSVSSVWSIHWCIFFRTLFTNLAITGLYTCSQYQRCQSVVLGSRWLFLGTSRLSNTHRTSPEGTARVLCHAATRRQKLKIKLVVSFHSPPTDTPPTCPGTDPVTPGVCQDSP